MTAVTIHRQPALPVVSPTLLDRAISAVSPTAGLRRMQARTQLAVATEYFGGRGQYLGARTDRRSMQDFNPAEQSANQDTIPDLGTLRSRSRDMYRNEPLATGAISGRCTAIVGPGLTMTPRIDRDLLGLSDEEADAWEAHAARLWNGHAGSTAFDAAGMADFHIQTSQVLWGTLVNGDILAVRRYIDRPGRLFGLAVQLVEADRVRSPNNRDEPGKIIAGVEIDPAFGEPVAYHVADRYPGDRLRATGAKWARVPRRDEYGEFQALLIGDHDRPDSLRSAPWLAPVIEPLRQLGTYSHAELSAAVISAFFTVFVKSPTMSGDGEGILNAAGTQPAQGGAPTTSLADLKLGAGAIADLAPGEEIQIANPGRPNAQFDPFWTACVRQIAVALQTPFEVLLMHYQSSYSASRAAMVQAWRVYMTGRTRLANAWCDRVYEWLLIEAVARGYLSAPGFFESPLLRAAWCGAEWTGPTMPQLDPVKEAVGARERMSLTLTTAEEETAALTGGNWTRKFAQTRKERRMMLAEGIQPAQASVASTVLATDPGAP